MSETSGNAHKAMLSGKERLRSFAVVVSVFLAGTFYCLYYGRIGYMPLDQSIVFDGAWRTLSGQIPFRDFSLPNTIVPILIQAAFFKVFGVTWFAFCLHAAVFNGFFCLLVFYLLKRCGGSVLLSFFYALLSGVVFYPPFGVPFQDQHAYFFTFLAILFACHTVTEGRYRVKLVVVFSIPILFLIAYFSKQIPTVFGILLVFAILLFFERKRLVPILVALCAGVLTAFAILLVLYVVLGIDLALFKLYFFQLPAQTADGRLTKIAANLPDLLDYMWSHGHKKIFFPFALVAIFFIGSLLFVAVGRLFSPAREKFELYRRRIKSNLSLIILAVSLLVISMMTIIVTNNQIENSVAYMFAAFGLSHLFLLKVMDGEGRREGEARPSSGRRIFYYSACVLIYCSAFFCAVNFDRHVNVTRFVQDLKREDENLSIQKKTMPSALAFLHWDVGPYYRGTPDDFIHVVDFFCRREGNFFLIGDSSILYAITGRPSVNPVLWFHPGLAMPAKVSPFFAPYENRLLEHLRRYNVRFILLETVRTDSGKPATWFTIDLAYFPKLQKIVKERGVVGAKFGVFTIIELKPAFSSNE